MDWVCTNCRYYELPTDALPCSQCSKCTVDGVNKWAPPVDEMADPVEKLDALCELHKYTMLSMVELRERLDSLLERLGDVK